MPEDTAVLLSGGLDSLAVAALRKPRKAVFVDYGQVPALAEAEAAKSFADRLNIEYHRITINCGSIGSGDLAGVESTQVAATSDWWPFRNQLLLTLASTLAVKIGVKKLLYGSVASDSIFQDGTQAFFDKYNALSAHQEGGIVVEAPYIDTPAIELMHEAELPLDLLVQSHSCHKSNFACGLCRGCQKRIEVLSLLGVPTGI